MDGKCPSNGESLSATGKIAQIRLYKHKITSTTGQVRKRALHTFLRVTAHVLLQCRRLGKVLFAELALEWFVTCVHL